MRRTFVCLAACLLWAAPAVVFSQENTVSNPWTGNVNLLLGAKFLEKDNWEPVEKQLQGGLLVDCRKKSWWVNIALDLLYAWDEEDVTVVDLGIGAYGAEVQSRTMEFNLGLRKIWESPKYVRPYIGGGFAIINGQIKSKALGNSVSDAETGYGVWLNAGLYVTLFERLNIGVDGRWSKAEVDLYDTQARVGGWHLGALAGLHW